MTGATGFLGQALLERLLADIPDCRVHLLIRPSAGVGGPDRLRRLVARPVFRSLRERLGKDEFERLAAERIEVVEGDVSAEIPDLPSGIDVVFHCAATVSFDPPIDFAFKTNLLGTVRLYEALHRSHLRPHVVQASTAYVAGLRKGVILEAPLEHGVGWLAELDAALSRRALAETESRDPERLRGFRLAAEREHRRAGPQTVSQDAERRRVEWVEQHLVEAGTERARTLGWADVYTLTKALSERAAEQLAADIPVSIVRPSIIESALRHPYPGWIHGFKMAEPLILAYGRGELPEFPGIPEGFLDVIPVDYVVNAMLAIAAAPPQDGPAYYHVCSGSRNPLRYKHLYELVRAYFEEHPLPGDEGPVRVPEWRFPGSGRIQTRLKAADRITRYADRAARLLPRTPGARELAERIDRRRRWVDFLRRYSDLYGAYTQAEVVYTDDKIMALYESLPAKDRAEFGFDGGSIDWRNYIVEVHCPSVTRLARAGRERRKPPEVRLSSGAPAAAVFDLEGTILNSNVVQSYLWLRLSDSHPARWPMRLAAVARDLPRHLATEQRDRGEFLRGFYRNFEDVPEQALRDLIDDGVSDLVLRRVAPAALRRIREHRRAGHRVVLITGAAEPLVEPLKPLFDEIEAVRLEVLEGTYTGFMSAPPLIGEARAAWLRQYARREWLDLRRSYAYSDSYTDLPLLRAVGHPVAVNPDILLHREALTRRWPVEEWKHSKGAPLLVPGIRS
jgi:HAD superfamily hydrolase (TIGR01490 family)